MNKKSQERMTNRIMLTMSVSFVAAIAMYYLYGAIGNNILKPLPTFVTAAAIFVIFAAVMMVCGIKEAKKLNLGIVQGYKDNLKARLYFNFEIFGIVAAILSLVIYFVGNGSISGYKKVMIVIAVAMLVYNIVLIAATFIYEALQKKKAKEARISRKASARADLKAKRSK
ncbi:MAG: hypothetical protein SPL89_06080 [Clostridia bacterium]|nr:hypothetical protein [Clostridia bacterium]